MQPLLPQLRHAAAATVASLQRHPRRVVAALTMAAGGMAVAAFGVAPAAGDPSLLPQTIVTEDVALPQLQRQLERLASADLQLVRSTVTRAADTADALLRRVGATDPLAARFLRLDPQARRLLDGAAGKAVDATVAADGTLLQLVARFAPIDGSPADTHFTRLTIARDGGAFSAKVETAELVPQARLGSGEVRSTLWAAVDAARLPDSIAQQLIEIFSADIDFHRQLKRGASFRVVYQAMTADDHPVTWGEGVGRILAAEFSNGGREHAAVWFDADEDGRGAYYGLDGKPRRSAFLASPLEFSRISSGFEMRLHPLLKTWRAHNGVDYAAPIGTAVRTIGDGIVEFAGRQNGYGNVVEIRHDPKQTTLYAHLNRIDVREGQRVAQGQKIGEVGATGWATGPHLHFEFRVDGVFRDPLEVAAAQTAVKLGAEDRPQFMQAASLARHKLDTAETVARFRGDAE